MNSPTRPVRFVRPHRPSNEAASWRTDTKTAADGKHPLLKCLIQICTDVCAHLVSVIRHLAGATTLCRLIKGTCRKDCWDRINPRWHIFSFGRNIKRAKMFTANLFFILSFHLVLPTAWLPTCGETTAADGRRMQCACVYVNERLSLKKKKRMKCEGGREGAGLASRSS